MSSIRCHAGEVRLRVEQALDVAPVWSGHPVRFALLTRGPRQFVAFYDADRQMTVGSRLLDSGRWQLVRLPSKLGWDSHNSVAMAAGKTQLYSARCEAHGWRIYQTSDWDFRGGGTIRFQIHFGPVTVESDGTLTQSYRHAEHGSGRWLLDEATLKPIGRAPSRDRPHPGNPPEPSMLRLYKLRRRG